MSTETAIGERPLLYSGPMVRALLSGAKTQTRRTIEPQPYRVERPDDGCGWRWEFSKSGYAWNTTAGSLAAGMACHCPHGRPGEHLWVRETFARRLDVDPVEEPDKARHYALYRADGTGLDEAHWHSYPSGWTPSILMPRWACRLVLEITGVRVERAQSISDADIIAEGIAEYAAGLGLHAGDAARRRELWAHLWDAVNGKRDGGKWAWSNDPWTWVIEFRRLEPRP